MSSTKQKHVHYDRGTKGGKTHGHRSSRDSGVGSSSASDRASLGTAPNESSFTQQQIEDQRHILSAVREALDAANEKIKSLEAQSAQLNTLLAESNKENRLLKREKTDLHNKVEDLLDLLDDERTANERLRRDSSPRSSTSDRPTRRIEAPPRPQANAGERRNSYYERPPIVPQAPPNPNPNPFTPLASRAPVVTYATAPAQVAYAPSTVSYAPAPVFAVSHPNHRTQTQPPNDGRYHLTPL